MSNLLLIFYSETFNVKQFFVLQFSPLALMKNENANEISLHLPWSSYSAQLFYIPLSYLLMVQQIERLCLVLISNRCLYATLETFSKSHSWLFLFVARKPVWVTSGLFFSSFTYSYYVFYFLSFLTQRKLLLSDFFTSNYLISIRDLLDSQCCLQLLFFLLCCIICFPLIFQIKNIFGWIFNARRLSIKFQAFW